MKGNDVSKLQEFLRDNAGYTGAISGNFGPLTRAAVGKWQGQKGIVISSRSSGYGSVGPKTRAMMACSKLVPAPSPPPSAGTNIEQLKTELARLQKLLATLLGQTRPLPG